jgi:hypothetical protein
MLLALCRLHRRIRARGKTRDVLFLVVLVNFEVLIGKVLDVISFFVGHHRVH